MGGEMSPEKLKLTWWAFNKNWVANDSLGFILQVVKTHKNIFSVKDKFGYEYLLFLSQEYK